MYASSLEPRALRRGIVLILVLGMLALMALIGVTFAVFAGQSLINGRNFAQGISRPSSEALMDFALGQLINDTKSPVSAIRGHSLLRDMYGNDSVYRGSNPSANPAIETGGLLSSVYVGGALAPLQLTDYGPLHSTATATPFYNQLQYTTNIPTSGQYYGLDFTRWILRFTNGVPQTYEVLEDDATTGVHIFTLSANLANPTNDPTFSALTTPPLSSSDWTSFIYSDPNLGANVDTSVTPNLAGKGYSSLSSELSPTSNTAPFGNALFNPFVLDGRYMRAFNGPGLTQPDTSGNGAYPFNYAAYGNFRLNGRDPDAEGMDEDYDACDLENWYLAIQSADGQVVIPSFHRPGILMAGDWSQGATVWQRAKILRPRQIDNSPLFPADPATPDAITGKLTYDVDNDGDGVSDSVWLDLGYPVQRDPGGRLFKPLFAFMVLGLNGRLPLNTVGNLQARADADKTNNSTLTLPASTGQVPYPGSSGDGTLYNPLLTSQAYLDGPLWDHTSHLGFSVNEINPKFALQNAPSNVYSSADGQVAASPYGLYPAYNATRATTSYTQYDNVGVSVALTQLRNILSGTIPTDVQNPVAVADLSAGYGYAGTTSNHDVNTAVVDGFPYVLPNNVADPSDIATSGTYVNRLVPPVAGRFGEPEGIPQQVYFQASHPALASLTYPTYWYTNPVRAGNSVNSFGSNDIMDDDFDGTDPPLTTQPYTNAFSVVKDVASVTAPTQYSLPLNSAAYTANATFNRNLPEFSDFFDGAGQMVLPTERSRRFVTPQDPAGTGRVVRFMARPANSHDYGTGSDNLGRTSFFRYFRAPGMPQELHYPYDNGTYQFSHYPYTVLAGDNAYGQRYLMPVLLPTAYSTNNSPPTTRSDKQSNRLHGYQAMLTPQIAGPATAPVIASMGAMPYDWDTTALSNAGDVPVGYANPINLVAPMINPYMSTNQSGSLNATPRLPISIATSHGPNLGALGKTGGTYPIPYADYADSTSGNQPYSYGSTTLSSYNVVYTGAQVVNGYLGGSLNKDEADEMNLYTINRADAPYGPSDLEWLYRKHDVDGATLNSRLSKLAPVSFLNPADGLTRRRLFSTDAWDLNTFAYSNDNPLPYAGVLGGNGIYTTDHDFTYNSRFTHSASPSLEGMNQVPNLDMVSNHYANFITTEFLPNPTLPPQSSNGNNIHTYVPNSSFAPIGTTTPITLPLAIDPSNPNTSASPFRTFLTNGFTNAQINTNTGLIIPAGTASSVQVQTPSLAHRDRKINLNMPLPIANDPAEPVRQKWCRETYQMLKAILPPASVDTPEELAALSQFVVNIIDFRDTDCTMTRFVNTDLEVTDVLTRSSSPVQTDPLDKTWSVSPAGVRFATSNIAAGHFPYDPSLYSPDSVETPAGSGVTFLVQHGMEYNPIALNEVMAYQAQYGKGNDATTLTTYQAMFIELVNTLTEEQNNPNTNQNSSAISLAGWDVVVAPDNYGWGRPDPISGNVNPIAWPPYIPNAAGDATQPPAATQRPYAATTDTSLQRLQQAVGQFNLTGAATIKGITGGTTVDYYVLGDYREGGASVADPTTIEGGNPVATSGQISFRLPTTFTIPATAPGSGEARYYWVYLRRPANPFDTAAPNQVRPNKEMVVVDAMRFPVIDAGAVALTPSTGTNPPTLNPVAGAPNDLFSAQRLQPYRGGHLVRVDTAPPSADLPTTGAASGVTTVCPPSPPYAYGYSEQTSAPAAAGSSRPRYVYTKPSNGSLNTTDDGVRQTINDKNSTLDDRWSHLVFHDRDFSSVAELLLVPGCPPGLFTKQFVEEAYPGNIFANKVAPLTTAAGTDDRDLPASAVKAPSGATNPSLVGRKNFSDAGGVPPDVTFPYLSDNFYYTAASVAPPMLNSGSLDAGYTSLTTEIGGWTGAGWHKMLEFFEVPSSANGAIGPAANGNNYDWARADLKPGQLNLNLIIDEEVFAGLIDEPRLNENLAAATSIIPYVVTQIDQNGYPVHDQTSGNIYGRSPIFNLDSFNLGSGGVLIPTFGSLTYGLSTNWGRGYVYRDPNLANYDSTSPTYPDFQQVHGIKAAFSDFLKLRHGGSGYLFGFGGGPTGSGDFVPGPLTLPLTTPTFPLAAERPYRSLSYPDINYTILRPASLPPSPIDTATPQRFGFTSPPLPSNSSATDPGNLTNLFQYTTDPNNLPPHVALNPVLSPMHGSLDTTAATPRDFPYVQDPGIKNPFLPIQFVNKLSPLDLQDPPLTGTGQRHLGPPYAVQPPSTTIPSAPFPPPIPPTPARRLFQIPDWTTTATGYTSNASVLGQYDVAQHNVVNAAYTAGNTPTDAQLATEYTINKPTITQQLSVLPVAASNNLALSALRPGDPLPAVGPTPPSLVDQSRAVFMADNFTPQAITATNNYLGAGITTGATPADYRQHPLYRTEMLQKIANLTTVRTHQFAVWISVGFFEVVRPGTAELGITDVLGQEIGLTAGRNVRYRSFFTIDRTKATGFNPYYPGNFRDCVTYRRRIE